MILQICLIVCAIHVCYAVYMYLYVHFFLIHWISHD